MTVAFPVDTMAILGLITAFRPVTAMFYLIVAMFRPVTPETTMFRLDLFRLSAAMSILDTAVTARFCLNSVTVSTGGSAQEKCLMGTAN